MRQRIAVVGGGVIGLATVEAILEDLDAEVTVYASEYTPNTTGDLSAGFIFPYEYGKNDEQDLMRWTDDTIKHLAQVRRENGEAATGISPISGYLVWRKKPVVPQFKKCFFGYRDVGRDEIMQIMNGDHYSGGWFLTTWTCSCEIYLVYLMKKLKQKGVKFIRETVISLNDIAERGYDILVNCTGFGALKLTGDQQLTPIQGQILQVKAPWVNHFIVESDGDCYILPRIDSVIVGGTHKRDAGLQVSKTDSDKIWAAATSLLPGLEKGTIIKEDIGIRPGREKIRIEVETAQTRHGKKYTLLHNYGHGGCGVTVHRGCAKDASALLMKHLHYKANL